MQDATELATRAWPYIKRILAVAAEAYEEGRWSFACTADDGDCVTVTLYVDEPDAWTFYDRVRSTIAEANLARIPIVVLLLTPESATYPGVYTKDLKGRLSVRQLASFVGDAA
jgi:hypothetical protein